MRTGRLVTQMPRDIGADAGERLTAFAPRWQFERDEALGEAEDELIVVGVSQADVYCWRSVAHCAGIVRIAFPASTSMCPHSRAGSRRARACAAGCAHSRTARSRVCLA